MITTIETLSVIIIAIISLPKVCQLFNRSSLLYSAYLLLGVTIGEIIHLNTRLMLNEVGNIGFILLLFLIGLEIEVPSLKDFKKTLGFSSVWFLIQLPLFLLAGWLGGLDDNFGLAAGAGICACSLGVAYKILQGQSSQIKSENFSQIVIQMVILEVISLILLVAADAIHVHGFGKTFLWQLSILILFIFFLRGSSGFVQNHLTSLLKSTNKWRVHRLFLALFAFIIVGEKLGLSAPKTAFFLGLFMSSTSDNGIKFEEELKGVAQRILIPIFFISLGTKISIISLFPWIFPAAVCITGFLYAVRIVIYSYFYGKTMPLKYFMLFCPNITMVAVATEILIHQDVSGILIDLLLVTGLIMTIIPAFLFPTPKSSGVKLISLQEIDNFT